MWIGSHIIEVNGTKLIVNAPAPANAQSNAQWKRAFRFNLVSVLFIYGIFNILYFFVDEMSDLKGQIRLLEEKNTSYMQTNMELEEVSSEKYSTVQWKGSPRF